MTITPGKYVIRNKGPKGLYVEPEGVNPDEGQASPLPVLFPVISIFIPPGVKPKPWSVEKAGDSIYFIKAEEAGLALATASHIYVAPRGPDSSINLTWKITAVPHEGDDVYLIESPDKPEGWVLPEDKPDVQVAYGPIIVFPTEPPTYPPSELWVFTKVD